MKTFKLHLIRHEMCIRDRRDREYCMSPSRTAQYKATIAKLKTEYKGKVDILCGIEWDIPVSYTHLNAKLIADLNRVKFSLNPYNINRLTLKAGQAALEDTAYFENCLLYTSGDAG